MHVGIGAESNFKACEITDNKAFKVSTRIVKGSLRFEFAYGSFLLQGGGVSVESMANFSNCELKRNKAANVSEHLCTFPSLFIQCLR